ncbi:glycosyltransferase [Curtobacterium sp. PhB146]|uniref:glycosyltransferase n=1 Tax=Curtobacterium sp. PhB146 TaxID=2485187 RepID=UPI001050D37D|nr:glycosyltransferase [Curtobacterium sp. PhB146]TCU44465.1 putative colanic acid biosynthesis glycosyltransferase [Curtobacterium sp. PhB146]
MVSTERPLISVIIATYNASQFIDRTLRSVASQELEGYVVEVVLVDGASTDDTVDRVRASGLPVVVRSEPDDGIYDAMNIGAEMASGRWVQFLNAGDTYSRTDSLLRVARVIDRVAGTGVTWAVAGAQNLQGGAGPARVIENLPYKRLRHLFGLQPHCHQACWFSTERFRALGGHQLDMGIVADYDLIARFGSDRRPASVNHVVIDYLGGGVSEVPAREIADRLHEARSRRFELGRLARTADRGASRVIGLLNGLRIRAGMVRRRYQVRRTD